MPNSDGNWSQPSSQHLASRGVRAKGQNLIERRVRKRRTQLFLRNLFTERDVVAIEEAMELFAKRFIVCEKWSQHERFEKPCGVILMPFRRTGLRTGLDHLVLGRLGKPPICTIGVNN